MGVNDRFHRQALVVREAWREVEQHRGPVRTQREVVCPRLKHGVR